MDLFAICYLVGVLTVIGGLAVTGNRRHTPQTPASRPTTTLPALSPAAYRIGPHIRPRPLRSREDAEHAIREATRDAHPDRTEPAA